MQCIVVKSDEFENSSPLYIFPLNPDYVAARSLRSLRSNKRGCEDAGFSSQISVRPVFPHDINVPIFKVSEFS